MKKLILLLFIPLVSFGQLTLETMSRINDTQSFKRTMIENGFSLKERSEGNIKYEKNVYGEVAEITAYYRYEKGDEDIRKAEAMMFVFNSYREGVNRAYQAIYEKVKDECEFLEIGEGIGGDIAYYNCPYKNPTKEMLELKELFKKEKLSGSSEFEPFLDLLNFKIGFNNLDMFSLIHFPEANKSHPDWLKLYVLYMKNNSFKTDELELLDFPYVKKETNEIVEESEDVAEVPFAVIENVPVFPGCEIGNNEKKRKCMSEKIAKFVQKRFNTDLAGSLGLTGRQRISVIFKIDKSGNVTGVRARAVHPGLEKEAIRVISLLPRMQPGTQKGKAVIVPYSLPIIFEVQEEEEPEPQN